jgi:glyoxylase-like metal-dependent hydrolase (beta-lactamase superfamily II)
VLVDGFPTGGLAANCYVLAPRRGGECVVVDPGEGAHPGLTELLDRHSLRPVAVLVTHGHADHMFSVAPVCGAHDIPAYIHPEDRALLSEPWRGLGPMGREMYGQLTLAEPDDVRELTDGAVIEAAGLRITVTHTPGHTRGCVVFGTGGDGSAREDAEILMTGDLLFRDGVGRTDLPGGSDEDMRNSLARILTFDDDARVFPGHGPSTTIGRERAESPYLRMFGLDPETFTTPRRGL